MNFPVSEVQFLYTENGWKCFRLRIRSNRICWNIYKKILGNLEEIKDAVSLTGRPDSSYIKDWYVEQIQMDTGCVIIRIHMYEKYYYEMFE